MVKEIRSYITIEKLPEYHCKLKPLKMVKAIPKSEVRKTPFTNEQDIKELAHRTFY